MKKDLGTVLKELRKKSGFTAKGASRELQKFGYQISDKTLSGYETGIRMPNADIFMALCQIYNCKNILEMFSFVKADYSTPNDDEWKLIEIYRTLDETGKNHIDTVLKWETDRIRQLENAKADTEATPKRFIAYYQKLASAGTGQIIFEDMPIDRVAIPDIPEYKRVSYAISVNGDSMSPLYQDGDMLLIEPTCSLNIGEIGIFIVGNESYVKKLGNNELISLNKGYSNIPLTEDSKCMGRVVELRGKL